MNYYPHHIGDFNNATRHLSRLERSIYLDLLHLYYDTEEPLPDDLNHICRKIIATSEDESTTVERVLNEYFVLTAEGYENDRCNEVIGEYQKRVDDASKAGKASAKARKANRIKASKGSTTVERGLNEGSTNQEPITSNQEPLTKYIPFDSFWNLYPRKTDRAKAEKAWDKLKVSEELFTLITNHLKTAFRDTEKKFIPHATTYLNGKRWQDEIIKTITEPQRSLGDELT